MRCDLHTHTSHSDGSYTPVELAREASEKNLIIALTDHNTVTGLPEFLKEAESLDLTAGKVLFKVFYSDNVIVHSSSASFPECSQAW